MSDDSRRALAQAILISENELDRENWVGRLEAVERVLQAHHEAEVENLTQLHSAACDEINALREQVAQLIRERDEPSGDTSGHSRRALAQAIHRALFKWTTPREDGSVEAIERVLQAHHEAEVGPWRELYEHAVAELTALHDQVAQLTRKISELTALQA